MVCRPGVFFFHPPALNFLLFSLLLVRFRFRSIYLLFCSCSVSLHISFHFVCIFCYSSHFIFHFTFFCFSVFPFSLFQCIVVAGVCTLWHGIAVLLLSTWYNVAVCVVGLLPQVLNLYDEESARTLRVLHADDQKERFNAKNTHTSSIRGDIP